MGVVWNNHAEPVSAEIVTGNYFEMLGVRPALGRLFVAGDETAEGANPVAVLNFDYWKSHLAEAPVEGKTLLINGAPFTIVGVAPPGFHSMVWGRLPDVYVPITMQRTVQPEWDLSQRSQGLLDRPGRPAAPRRHPRPGGSLDQSALSRAAPHRNPLDRRSNAQGASRSSSTKRTSIWRKAPTASRLSARMHGCRSPS